MTSKTKLVSSGFKESESKPNKVFTAHRHFSGKKLLAGSIIVTSALAFSAFNNPLFSQKNKAPAQTEQVKDTIINYNVDALTAQKVVEAYQKRLRGRNADSVYVNVLLSMPASAINKDIEVYDKNDRLLTEIGPRELDIILHNGVKSSFELIYIAWDNNSQKIARMAGREDVPNITLFVLEVVNRQQ
ncbi:MAG: hypothetical protein NT051_05415 [Candidatus Micrarchaeota archaeon]|nr:hypothetical protein [Candidatus Micrarchaeota archaeon]